MGRAPEVHDVLCLLAQRFRVDVRLTEVRVGCGQTRVTRHGVRAICKLLVSGAS